MKDSHSVEARRRRALPYYNVKRRRQNERERETERSRRRREEQQDADREREAERGRRRREEQQDVDREREAESCKSIDFTINYRQLCIIVKTPLQEAQSWKRHHRSAVGGALSWDHCHWRDVATVWRVLTI